MISNIPVVPSKGLARNTCVFGGAFNPPQLAHANLIRELLDHPSTVKVVVLPSGKRADKQFGISDGHRIAMIRAMVAEISRKYGNRVMLDLHFVETEGLETTTRDEYRHAREAYGESVSHVFGSDVLEAMTTWWDLDRQTGENSLFVARQVPKTVIVRPWYENVSRETREKLGNVCAVIFPKNAMEISSTHVRESVRSVEDLRNSVPALVADYILENELYNFAFA